VAVTTTSTTNFDKTVTTLVLRMVAENLRKRTFWLDEGAWLKGSLIPGTNLIRYVAYGDLPTTTQALTEAVPPTEEALTIAYEEFGSTQYGRTVAISDLALRMSPHDLMGIAAERVAFNALATLDRAVGESTRDYITAPVQLLPAGRANRAAIVQNSSDYLIGDLVRDAVTSLRAANIPTFPDGYYHGIIHPFVARDLMEEAGTAGQWLDIRKYGGPDAETMLTGEIGRYFGVRFMETNNSTYIGASGAASAHIFRTVIYGPGYFAFGDLQSIESYMVRPGGDHSDPLAQKAIVGWKANWGTKILALTGVGPRFRGIDTSASAAAAG
jgi:N4-gp56 family major capsid protein